MSDFQTDLAKLINYYSQENLSDTPDYILAIYLVSCLEVWNKATALRDQYYGHDHSFKDGNGLGN